MHERSSSGPGSAAAGTPRVLVVDDDADIARFIEINLKVEGFSVLVASNGQQALDIIGRTVCDW